MCCEVVGVMLKHDRPAEPVNCSRLSKMLFAVRLISRDHLPPVGLAERLTLLVHPEKHSSIDDNKLSQYCQSCPRF